MASVSLFSFPSAVQAQETSATPALVSDAVKYQLEDFNHTRWGLRYRVRRQDGRTDIERELIESRDGNVARTLSRNGEPLSAAEESAERVRLEKLTASDMARRRRQAESTEKYGVELIGVLPQAMLYTMAAGQPQIQAEHLQAVYDFEPNPQFHPATTSQSILPSLKGRVWIDTETHHLVRIELNVVKNVNLMMGILARVYSGGTLTYEQHPVGGGHYGYTRIDINVKLRELMVKTVPYHSTFTATHITYMPVAPGYQEAVRALLSRP